MEKLTLKQRRFLKHYLETGNASQSALKAGYSHRQSGNETLSNLVIQGAFQQLLDKRGLTEELISKKINEGLNAQKVVGYLNQYKKTKDGKIEKIEPDQVVSNEFVEVPDHYVQHKYLETLIKLKKKFETDKKVDVSVNVDVTIDIFKEAAQLLREKELNGTPITSRLGAIN